MKKTLTLLFVFILIIASNSIQAQNNIGVGTNTPNTEAKLDIRSTTQGLLIPRMSTTQRLALANETSINRTANGMMVYDITSNRLMIYDSLANSGNGKWQALVPTDSVANVWKLNGNAGTNPATNFIGTTDSINMILKTKNKKHTTFFADGSWLIGDSMQGGGTKTFFDASKGAFRTGGKELFGTSLVSWDKDSLGENSFACGTSSLAKGNYSMAIGANSRAIGDHSFALGKLAHALGEYSYAFGVSTSTIGIGSMSFGNSNITYGGLSVAFGQSNRTNGFGSMAFGQSGITNGLYSNTFGKQTTSNADYSVAMGNRTKSNGFSSLVIGQYNDTIVVRQTSISSITPLFIIGNGTWDTSLSNAMVVRQDGNVGIGTNTPSEKIDVNGKTKTTNFQMTSGASSGKILQSDASGNASWTTISALESDPQVSSTTTNLIPKWNGSALVDGIIQDDGTSIGIGGIPSTGNRLTIYGATKTTNFQMTSGAGLSKILQSDASGNASWVNATSLTITETDPEVSSTTTNLIPKWNGTALVDGIITDNGTNIGISTTPSVKLHVNGALAIVPNTGIVVNTDNFNVTVGNESYIRLSGDGAAAASRTITLSNGLAVGQILFIECTSNGVQVDDNAATNNTNVNVAHTIASNDVIQLLWNGTDWLEVSFSDN